MADDDNFDGWMSNNRSARSAITVRKSARNSVNGYELKACKSGPESFGDSVAYAEPLNKTNHERTIEASCGDSTLENKVSRLKLDTCSLSSVNCAGDGASDTYRCETPLSSDCSKTRVERRCKIIDPSEHKKDIDSSSCHGDKQNVQRYTLNGHKVVHISTSSGSGSARLEKLNGEPLYRQIAHEEWIRDKQREMRRKKEEERLMIMKKKEEEERLAREKEEKEHREREIFQKWAEKKRREEMAKQEAMEKELELQQKLKEIEEKTAPIKTLYVKRWIREKEKEKKTEEKKLKMKQKREEEERRKKLERNVEAYEKWQKKSRNIPKPATQGLLPQHNAKPAFLNPQPWRGVVDDEGEKSEERFF